MIGRYKEVWCGVLIGVSIWALDVVLHVSERGQYSFGSFAREMIVSDPPRILFRLLFLIISTALGHSLWQTRERERRMRDLQMAINLLQRQIVNPLLLIVGYSSGLALKEGWPASRETIELMAEIRINARKINEAIKQWPAPNLPQPGETEARVFEQSVS